MTTTKNAKIAAADSADRVLVIDRVFKASPDRVFKAWTDPVVLAEWYGPEGFTTKELKMDVRPGGAFRGVMVSPEGKEYPSSGVYREVDPPKRLVMTFAWEEEDGTRGHETTIEVTFEAAPGGTRMRFVQRLFTSVESRDGHSEGWQSSFNLLDGLLA